jgi:hypothetical protein
VSRPRSWPCAAFLPEAFRMAETGQIHDVLSVVALQALR